jgi:hypothetical protein
MSGSSRPSGFSRDVPRSVQALVRVAATLIAPPMENERGAFREVVGGVRALQAAVGDDDDRTTRRKVATAEVFGLMRRSGSTWKLRLFVRTTEEDRALAVLRANMPGSAPCVFCAAPVDRGQHCRHCQPAFRRDRAWKQSALNLLHEGKSIPSIAAVLAQPIYPLVGDPPLTGVVANLLAEAPDLVPDAFREGYRLAVGAEVKQLASVLTSRNRQRRHRRGGAHTG